MKFFFNNLNTVLVIIWPWHTAQQILMRNIQYVLHKDEQKPYLEFTVLLHLNLDDKLIKSEKNPLQHQSNVKQVTK